MIGAGIDGELDRKPLALLPRDSPVVTAFGQVAALLGRRPVVELADQDQRRHRHVALQAEAGRIEARSPRGICPWRCVRSGCARPTAAPAGPPCENPTTATRSGSTDGLPDKKIQRAIGIIAGSWRSPPVQVRDATRAEPVDGQRHVAPRRNSLAPALVDPPPVAIAAVQQHDRGRGTGIVGCRR